MQAVAILWPVTVLALWTLIVLTLVPIKRFRASFAGKVGPGDFRYGESAKVPGDVSLPNRNYMNLLELPVLFYVVCILVFVTSTVDHLYIVLAWIFVASRVVHSLIHVTYNNVMHRLAAFAIGNVVLVVIWLRFALGLLAR